MKYLWLLYVAGAALSWGAYVVTIDHGRKALAAGGIPPAIAGMRAFLFIGIAYFVMAVLVPGYFLMNNKVPSTVTTGWSIPGSILSIIAGALGAGGALCIVFAVGNARRYGSPQAALYVAPLVFSFAPIINCLISLLWDPPEQKPSPMFFAGLILAVIGAACVLYFKPAEGKAHAVGTPPAATAPTTQGH